MTVPMELAARSPETEKDGWGGNADRDRADRNGVVVRVSDGRGPGRSRVEDPALAREVVARYEAGETLLDLARSYDVSVRTVTRWLLRNGRTPRPRGRRPELHAEVAGLVVRRLRTEGRTLAEVAELLGVSIATVDHLTLIGELAAWPTDVHGHRSYVALIPVATRLHAAGMPRREVARLLDLSIPTVRKLLVGPTERVAA